MSLGNVKHQAYAQRLIRRAVMQGRIPHAYLFHGPDGVGKETFALGLAQLLLCNSPVDTKLETEQAKSVGVGELRMGCAECEECRAVELRTHPDLHLIYRQLNREHPDPVVRKRKALDLGVDVLRHFVIEKVGLTPIRGRAKVFIIREADRITVQAQNALLKTLEEPPGTTFIILLVTAVDRLLPTTLSRCQAVQFDALPTAFVQDRLVALLPQSSPEQIEWYARFGNGSLGGALQCAEDDLYGLNQHVLDELADLPTRRTDDLMRSWTDMSKSLGASYRKHDPDITDTEAGRRAFKSIFRLAATWYADILRVGSGDKSAIVNADRRSQIARTAGSLRPSTAAQAINRIAHAEHHLDLNANTQLCIETLLTDLAYIARNETAQAVL